MKIENDKYYTPRWLAGYCVNKTKELFPDITEFVEPSGGAGVFLDYLPKETISYDIEPKDDRIIKGDFLKQDIPYKTGRCIIGNPPYGERGNGYVVFYNKAVEISDYISFILPISQYNNNIKLYKFNLIWSEDLGKIDFSGIKVHCCLNIYKRPDVLNKKPNYKLQDVEIIELRNNKNRGRIYNGFTYDYAICAWGAAIGKQIEYENQYAKEFYFIIHNSKLKDEILYVLSNADWVGEYAMTATPNLLHWQVYKYLKKEIEEIK